jgi:hypothetical protein
MVFSDRHSKPYRLTNILFRIRPPAMMFLLVGDVPRDTSNI